MAGVALGILAGGQGRRFGGRDKGWIEVDGQPQIRRVLAALGDACDAVLISANRHLDDYAALGARVVSDRGPAGEGPFAGLASLFGALGHDTLLTVPVDVRVLPVDFVARMLAVETEGVLEIVLAHDEDGLQPLIARYPRALAAHAIETFESGRRSVRDWQHRFPIHPCRFDGFRFGNLNSPDDL